MPWTCPDCKRSFGRTNQSHGCAPSGTVDDYFDGRPDILRRVYDKIETHVTSLDGVHVDPVTACIMFKRARTFAEVRAKKDRLELWFLLSRTVADDRIRKTLALSAHRTAYVVDVARVKDVDRTVRDWLTEAYASSPV